MAEPAYRRVYSSIREKIINRHYDVGAILPAEPELEKAYGVSRTTIRKAIDMLEREGFLSVRQGFGTQVINRKSVQNLNKFSSISDSLAQNGCIMGLRRCFIERIGASDEISNLLGVPVHTPLVCIHRIKTSNGAPIILCTNYILEQLVPGLDMHLKIDHLYRFLKERYGIVYSGARDTISSCNATFEQAQMLDIEPMKALISVRRVCYSGTRPCEVDDVAIIADLFAYEVCIGDITP